MKHAKVLFGAALATVVSPDFCTRNLDVMLRDADVFHAVSGITEDPVRTTPTENEVLLAEAVCRLWVIKTELLGKLYKKSEEALR